MLVLVYTPLVVAHLSFSFLMWVVLFGLLLGTDQLDPMALQKNMFPSCNVCADRDMGYKRMYYIHTLYSMPRIPHRPLP